MRTQTHASKYNYGKTATDSSAIAVIDKMLQFVPMSLYEKLLQATNLDLGEFIKQVNAFETCHSAVNQYYQWWIRIWKSYNVLAGSANSVEKPPSRSRSGPTWNKTCSNCHKLGHFREVCYNRMGKLGNSGSLQEPAMRTAAKRNHSQAFWHNHTSFEKQSRAWPLHLAQQIHTIGDKQEEEELTELVEMVSSATDSEELVWANVEGVIIEM